MMNINRIMLAMLILVSSPVLAGHCDKIELYEHDSYRGKVLELGKSRFYDLHSENFGDKASSICVPSGWTAVLYEHRLNKGERITIEGPARVSDLKRNSPDGKNWGDRISSVAVIKPNWPQDSDRKDKPNRPAMRPTTQAPPEILHPSGGVRGDAVDQGTLQDEVLQRRPGYTIAKLDSKLQEDGRIQVGVRYSKPNAELNEVWASPMTRTNLGDVHLVGDQERVLQPRGTTSLDIDIPCESSQLGDYLYIKYNVGKKFCIYDDCARIPYAQTSEVIAMDAVCRNAGSPS